MFEISVINPLALFSISDVDTSGDDISSTLSASLFPTRWNEITFVSSTKYGIPKNSLPRVSNISHIVLPLNVAWYAGILAVISKINGSIEYLASSPYVKVFAILHIFFNTSESMITFDS